MSELPDIGSVLIETYKQELLDDKTKWMVEHRALDQVLFTLQDDVNDYVVAIVSRRLEADVSNGLVRIHTEYVPGVIVNWQANSITYRMSVSIGNEPATEHYDRLNLYADHGVRHEKYLADREAINAAIVAVDYQLSHLHEKELQLKGAITTNLLVELGMDHLLKNGTIQQMMSGN
jgi:hypothetical protein